MYGSSGITATGRIDAVTMDYQIEDGEWIFEIWKWGVNSGVKLEMKCGF